MAKGSRILFDTPEKEPADIAFLEGLGHEVTVCHGPDHGKLCPILSGAGCELVETAHGIVFELDLDRPQHRAILAAYRRNIREDIPIRVVVKPGQVGAYPELLNGLHVWTRRPAAGDLDGLAAEVEAMDRSIEG